MNLTERSVNSIETVEDFERRVLASLRLGSSVVLDLTEALALASSVHSLTEQSRQLNTVARLAPVLDRLHMTARAMEEGRQRDAWRSFLLTFAEICNLAYEYWPALVGDERFEGIELALAEAME